MNIIDGIIGIIFEYHQITTWSNQFKGKAIELSDDDSKAMNNHDFDGYSVRADFCIDRGDIIKWELECFQPNTYCYFYGVVSSKEKNFNSCPVSYDFGDARASGIADSLDTIHLDGVERYTYDDEDVDVVWNKPEMPDNQVFKLQFKADWTDTKECKLSIYYQGKKMNDKNDEYTLLLPELDKDDVWYPCVSMINKGAYCIIRDA